jgi:hypothetical protein
VPPRRRPPQPTARPECRRAARCNAGGATRRCRTARPARSAGPAAAPGSRPACTARPAPQLSSRPRWPPFRSASFRFVSPHRREAGTAASGNGPGTGSAVVTPATRAAVATAPAAAITRNRRRRRGYCWSAQLCSRVPGGGAVPVSRPAGSSWEVRPDSRWSRSCSGSFLAGHPGKFPAAVTGEYPRLQCSSLTCASNDAGIRPIGSLGAASGTPVPACRSHPRGDTCAPSRARKSLMSSRA